jgi:hypothetical protein
MAQEKGLEAAKLLGLPSDAEPTGGFNSVDITSTTEQEIISAPAATKKLYISKLIIQNKTVAEEALITIQDDAATPVEIATVLVSTAAGNGGHAVFDFVPPIGLTLGKGLDGVAGGSLGDTIVHASGWVGTPGA